MSMLTLTDEPGRDSSDTMAAGEGAMNSRVAALAAQFAALNDEAIALVTGCTDEQWRQPCAGEGWSVGVVAHHIGAVHRDFIHIVDLLAAGRTFSPGGSMEVVDQSNAQHAHDHAAIGKAETLDALRTNGAALARSLRSLRDEQLDNVAGTFGGRELSVNQVVEYIVLGHPREHLASLRATLAN